MHPDPRLHLDDAGGDFDEAQAQRVELGAPPHRALRHRVAQAPHQPVGAGVQEQPKLIGGGLGAGGAIRRQMRLEGLDVVFGLATPAIDTLVERAMVAFAQIGDDETRIGPLRADFDPGDDPLDPAPALGAVEELLEAADLAVARRGLEARLRAGLEGFNAPAQRRGRRDAEDVVDAVGPTPVEDLRAAIVAVGVNDEAGYLDPKFLGFDGNYETEYVSIARFLVEKLDNFSKFKGREFNSHTPMVERYKRMCAKFDLIRPKLVDGRELSVDELIELLNREE
jgi:hypothetical protein